MANKKFKLTKNEVVKSFVLKVANQKKCAITNETLQEYKNYYNKVSQWINNNLTKMTIGDLIQYAPTVSKKGKKQPDGTMVYDTPLYVTYAMSDEWKNKPLYYIFKKEYNTNNANNLLYEAIRNLNVDEYDGNQLNFYSTNYRLQGYINRVFSNYRTKINTLDIKIKKTKVDENSNVETLELQTMYEIYKLNLKTNKDWEDRLEYLTIQENPNQNTIDRTKILFNYFINNSDTIFQKMEELSIKQLTEFGGCKMKDNTTSMTINIQDFKIKRKENSIGYIMSLPFNKKIVDVELYGHKQTIKGHKNSYTEIVDIVNKHGNTITFKIKNDQLFAIITSDTEVTKPEPQYKKIVGVDVNIKHTLMVTSEKDNGKLKGYINLYKEVLKNDEFKNLLNKTELDNFKSLSKIVTFCPIEYDFLFSRIFNDEYTKKELAFTNVLYDIQKQLKNTNNILQYNYISCVNKLRAKYKAYFVLKMSYMKQQKIYDTNMGFFDISTESKETMDQRRSLYPFINTEIAQNIITKMNNVQQDINGCLKNIFKYTYTVFENNNYDTIVLENLENANFEKHNPLPNITSLLKYHKVQGLTIQEAEQHEKVGNLIQNDNYIFQLNEDNKIINADYSQKAYYKVCKALFFNQAIKTLHFASVKDEMIKLSNNNKVSVAIIPPEYTSQIDSNTHKLYFINKDGKLLKADKKTVRKTQEKHINGLNADFNAASNIKYVVQNETWRNLFTNKTKNTYGLPILTPSKKGQSNIITQLMKINATQELVV